MLETIHKHYAAFYDMLLVTTMLSNHGGEDYDADCGKIIDFIGSAYALDENTIAYCKKLIAEELVAVSTNEDINAFHNSRANGTPDPLDSLFSMKADALRQIESVTEKMSFAVSPSWFDYTHLIPYYPEIRFHQLVAAASTGHPHINKAVAILCLLGIGTKPNADSGIYRLLQCALWGDTPSLAYLAKAYEMQGKEKEAKAAKELVGLTVYIEEGRTVLPKEVKEKTSKEAQERFAFITSIYQDIVINCQRAYIDYSFVEVILQPELDYYKKLDYINRYKYEEWKDATNSSHNPASKIGFRLGGKK